MGLLVVMVSHAETAETIRMLFGLLMNMDQKNHMCLYKELHINIYECHLANMNDQLCLAAMQTVTNITLANLLLIRVYYVHLELLKCHAFLKFLKIQHHSSAFTCVGLTVDRFVAVMSEKMFAQDEDERIRQMFLAFDMQCMYEQTGVITAVSLVVVN